MAWGALLVAAIALGWMADESWARGRRCRGRVAVQEAEVQVEACQAPAPVKAAEPAKVPAKTKTAPQPKAAERPKVSEKPYLSETPAEKPKVVEKPKADDMPRTVEKPKAVEKPKVSEKPAETKAPDKSKGVPATAIPVPRTDAGWVQRQAQINARVKQGNVDLIFIGDSITQGWEGAKDIWQQFYG
jgi:outer membrane biosynthesis protein TonB